MVDLRQRYVIAVDQGTSSTKAIAVDGFGAVRARAQIGVSQQHPAPGHVEQDAAEILRSTLRVLDDVVAQLDRSSTIAGIGLSTQRESAVVWERSSGKPLGPLLGWQDRRTVARAEELRDAGAGAEIRRRSGLPLDPMFSALKFEWLLDDVDPDRRRARDGEIVVGTVDAWLVASLTGESIIEAGNASRTQLMNLSDVAWDPHLLETFNLPESVLPAIVRSDQHTEVNLLGRLRKIPIAGVLGDSHAALYGHGARKPGSIKATYGTGSSVMGLVDGLANIDDGLVSTLAWQTDEVAYAGEGNILSSGATLVWLSSILGVDPEDLLAMAEANRDPHNVDLVPAIAGLGSPWWDDAAVASLSGFDLGTSRASLAAAAADSIVLQVEDVIAAFDRSGTRCESILVDGGPSANDWLMQRQADLSRRAVIRPSEVGLSALGAAHLAGSTTELFESHELLVAAESVASFEPRLSEVEAQGRRDRWNQAVRRSRGQEVTSNDT